MYSDDDVFRSVGGPSTPFAWTNLTWRHPSIAIHSAVFTGGMYNHPSDGKRIHERKKGIGTMAEEQAEQQVAEEAKPVLSQAARRERLSELADAIGENAVVEGDKLIVETGEPVAIYFYVQPDGSFMLTRWMTASTPNGHPRWREAAEMILNPSESIHTSALGGGFLIEIEREIATIQDAVALSRDNADRGAGPAARSRVP